MKTILFVLVTFITINILPQTQTSYYIPRNVLEAYKNETRSYDGNPGKNYWQNRTDYEIKVEIDPETRLLKGSEKIVYTNNSPDSLSDLYIRLYYNISKPNARRDFSVSDDLLTEGVKLEKFYINGTEFNPDSADMFKYYGTNLRVILPEDLNPGDKIELKMDWSLVLPSGNFIRMGRYDSTSYFVAYWYPQIAVYDDVDGWDRNEYTGYQEMYNDFGNFNVEITLPVGYHVWSTGVWQNPSDILTDEYLNRYNSALENDKVVRIFTTDDLKKPERYKKNTGSHTFIFNAEYIPDFAFGFSDHYLWDAVSYKVKDEQRRVYVAAAYKESSEDFKDVAYYAYETVKFFSEEMPGVKFPYPSITVFNGSGGMEFPMIVNNGSARSKAGTVGVTSHEIAHQYMPFYMGTNERKYAFMDEGWAVMFPFDLQERMVEGNNPRENNARGFSYFAGNESEMPLSVPSTLLIGSAYRVSAYARSGMAYEILRDFLGDEKFKFALHEFMNRWNGKHPIPTDFYFTFNDVLGEDLNWFWKPWFYDFGYPDLSIGKVEIKDDRVIVEIEKLGNLPVPVELTIKNNEEIVKKSYYTADVWKTGNRKFEITLDGIINFDTIILGSNAIPDSEPANNFYNK